MMTSSNGNIFHVTGPLCGEFTGHRWIPLTKASGTDLWCFFFICAWINGWVNNCEADDLRRHRAHYDVIVMLNIWGLVCARCRYQGQGQMITSHRHYCLQVTCPCPWYLCWHTNLHLNTFPHARRSKIVARIMLQKAFISPLVFPSECFFPLQTHPLQLITS